MTLAVAVAAAMFVGVIAYALFGGADFGSGFYDLTAGGGRRARELRMLDRSQHRPGVGSQPCLAHLRLGDLVDRVSRRIRRGDDYPVRPLDACTCRDCVAGREFCVS